MRHILIPMSLWSCYIVERAHNCGKTLLSRMQCVIRVEVKQDSYIVCVFFNPKLYWIFSGVLPSLYRCVGSHLFNQHPALVLANASSIYHFDFRHVLSCRQVSQCDAEALATRFGCLFFELSACRDFESVQHVFYEAVRRSNRGTERGGSVRPMFVEAFVEDKALNLPSFFTPCYKELPAPATAKLVTVKTSRAQSKRRATTFTLLKGFKIFWHWWLWMMGAEDQRREESCCPGKYVIVSQMGHAFVCQICCCWKWKFSSNLYIID